MNHFKHLRNVLNHCVKKLAVNSSEFLSHPDLDFSRKRKLSFSTVVNLILCMGSSSLKDELLHYFDFSFDTVSSSAFVQARSKISPLAFRHLFDDFNRNTKHPSLFHGFHLYSIDGSSIPISHDPHDTDTYIPQIGNDGNPVKGYNAFHLTALYDLLDHTYDDIIIQGEAHLDEKGAYNQIVDHFSFSKKAIMIADRGFESINSFVHAERSGNFYLTRVKDIHSKTSVTKSFGVPKEGEFDIDARRILTRRCTNEIKAHPELFKWMPKNQKFDFFGDDSYYYFSCRIVRFQLTDDTYETIITNLERDEFSTEDIKELYHKRWGIETSFRKVKYAIGLNAFHAKKRDLILQEIYARLTLYNFCERMVKQVTIPKKKRKHAYQVNFTRTCHIIKKFLKRKSRNLSAVDSLIAKEILPIRAERSFPRNVRHKSAVCFNYRFD